MERPEMRVVLFDSRDVIATSESYTFTGFYNQKQGDGKIAGKKKSAFRTYMYEQGMIATEKEFANVSVVNGEKSITMNRLFDTSGAVNKDAGDTDKDYSGTEYADYVNLFNGNFSWDGSKFFR